MGRQPADAADLAQDTFIRALAGVDRFRGDSSYRTWLLGIARNVHREWVRSSRRQALPTEDVDVVLTHDTAGDDAAVLSVLALMPLDERELLVLRYVEGLASKDIAQLLGISDAAVRQRISRAAGDFRERWNAG